MEKMCIRDSYKTSKETAAQEEKPDDGLAFGDAINKPVSYTHLEVYKRQAEGCFLWENCERCRCL